MSSKYRMAVAVLCCLPSLSFGATGDQDQVFGNRGPSGRSGTAPHIQAARSESRQRMWQRDQEFALGMYRRVLSGDAAAAGDLKNAANQGNRWAALQYGYLAHTGQLPGLGGRPDYTTAVRAYNLASKRMEGGRLVDINGNYAAAYNMGLMYYYGQGVRANGAEALRWFRAAESAYKGDSRHKAFWPATVYIAQILERGYGVPKNEREALEYWERSARANEAEGLYGYGIAILNGRGGIQNPYRAYPLLVQAADRWHIGAMLALADYQGRGDRLREANPVDAVKWLMIAAVADRRHNRRAERALAALPPPKQQQVRSQVRSWLGTHGNVPKAFDWKQPINDTIPQR